MKMHVEVYKGCVIAYETILDLWRISTNDKADQTIDYCFSRDEAVKRIDQLRGDQND